MYLGDRGERDSCVAWPAGGHDEGYCGLPRGRRGAPTSRAAGQGGRMNAVIDLRAAALPTALEQSVQRAFVDACLLDVLALKPGNVGVHGSGHGMDAAVFIRSTIAAAPAIAGASQSV